MVSFGELLLYSIPFIILGYGIVAYNQWRIWKTMRSRPFLYIMLTMGVLPMLSWLVVLAVILARVEIGVYLIIASFLAVVIFQDIGSDILLHYMKDTVGKRYDRKESGGV